MPVDARYYTDPACSASWAAEPRRRALLVEFGTEVPFTYVMRGLARDYAEAQPDALPIRSTYPACMAVKAASEQGLAAADRYLRAVREGLFCFGRRLDSTEPLVDVAREVALDEARFRIDLASNAIVEAFGADLDEARTTGRDLPAIRFGPDAWVEAAAPYENWRAAAIAAGARPTAEERPDPLGALRRFGRMAPAEVEAVCDLSHQAADTELRRLEGEGRVRPLQVLTGVLWELAYSDSPAASRAF